MEAQLKEAQVLEALEKVQALALAQSQAEKDGDKGKGVGGGGEKTVN